MLVLSVDVDDVPDLTAREGVSAMPTFLTWWRGRRTSSAVRGADMRAVRAVVLQAQSAAEEVLTSEAIARSMKPSEPVLRLGGSGSTSAPQTINTKVDEEDFYGPTAASPPFSAVVVNPQQPRVKVAEATKEVEAPPAAAESNEDDDSSGSGRIAAIGPDGVSWWVDAMADLAARTKRPVTAADMLRMCRDGSFDSGFIAFAARALGIPIAAAAEAVSKEAASEIGELEAIVEKEAGAEAAGTAMKAQGISV